jgi:DNA repair ATPase RecN
MLCLWLQSCYDRGMDVERTMQFILDMQARAEIRMEKAERRMEKAERRMEKSERRTEKIDKRIDAIAKLVQQGMRMIAKHDAALAQLHVEVAELIRAQKRTEALVADVARAQKATERSLRAFLDSMRHGRNGH